RSAFSSIARWALSLASSTTSIWFLRTIFSCLRFSFLTLLSWRLSTRPALSNCSCREFAMAVNLVNRVVVGSFSPLARPAAKGTSPEGGRPHRYRPRKCKESSMSDHHTYKKIELVGSSRNSIDDAIANAIAEAAKTLDHLEWFEVTQV